MDQLRRLREDDDEKGVSGFILMFVATQMLFEPLFAIIMLFQAGRAFGAAPLLNTIFKIVGIAYLVFIFFTIFCLYKIPRYAVKITKVFLAFRLIFLTFAVAVNFHYALYFEKAIGEGLFQFHSVWEMILKILLLPLAYIFIYSLLWYVFLIRSKTVQENFGNLAAKE